MPRGPKNPSRLGEASQWSDVVDLVEHQESFHGANVLLPQRADQAG
jgi:hypothetical protein